MREQEVAIAEVDRLYDRLNREAEAAGYHLNPDTEFTKGIVRSLINNERRYGYRACPCRLASENEADDRDIICPCDYRDADLNDYNACYCALYVSGSVLKGLKLTGSIPERRPVKVEDKSKGQEGKLIKFALPIWHCRVCGYLCAREQPPEVCPICKAKKERFEQYLPD